MNDTHILESCGMYAESYFHILKLDEKENQPNFTEVYRSDVF